jgi:hypothetical protein
MTAFAAGDRMIAHDGFWSQRAFKGEITKKSAAKRTNRPEKICQGKSRVCDIHATCT